MRRTSSVYLSILILSFVALFMFAACGGREDDDSGDSDGDENTDGDETDGCGSSDALAGIWKSTDITIEIDSDLNYHATGINNTAYDVYGYMSLEGCTAELAETEGAMACPEEQIGRYSYTVDADTLTFTLKSDACAGRVMGLDGKNFTRQ